MTTTVEGQLEIDHIRGVIYFHVNLPKENLPPTLLRICGLPRPIPAGTMLDLTIRPLKQMNEFARFAVLFDWAERTASQSEAPPEDPHEA
jgi:hypothetical protein